MELPAVLRHPGRFTLLVTGGRTYADEYTLFDYLDRILAEVEARELVMAVVQGGAAGADAFARTWAFNNPGVVSITEPAKWELYGNRAGIIRNQVMLDKYPIDLCLAAPGGRGTDDMVRRCGAAGVPVTMATETPGDR